MTKATATASSATDPRQCQRLISKFEGHAVARGLYLGANALGQVGRELSWMRARHGHAVVREDRETGLGVTDDPLSVGEAEVGQLGATLHEDHVDHYHVGLVLLRDAVVVRRVGYPAETIPKSEAKCLDLVRVNWARR